MVAISALGDWLGTVLTLFGLGLVMAFSPTTFGIELDIIKQAPKARLRVLVVVAGVGLAASMWAGLLLVVSPDTLHALWTGEVRPLIEQEWFDAAVGVLLVGAGMIQWVRGARPRTKPRPRSRLDRPRVLLTVVWTESLISATGPATMYLVVRTIGTTPPELWPIEYLIFLVGLATPYVVLALSVTQIPALGRRWSAAQGPISRRDLRRPVALALGLVGLAVLTSAVVQIVPAGT